MFEHNGKRYARVTEVLAQFSDFSHIDPAVLSAKAAIGTAVHEAIHELVSGQFPAVSGRALRYLQCFEKWRERLQPEFVFTEQRFFDDSLMITGAIDALVKFPGDEFPTLVDYKTAATESPVSWPMQAHLYGRLCNLHYGRISPRYLFLRLNDNLDMPIVHVYQYQENTMNRCLEAVRDFWQKINSDRR